MAIEGFHNAKKLLEYIIHEIKPALGEQESRSIAYLLLEKKFRLHRKDIIIGTPLSISGDEIDDLKKIILKINLHEPIQYILEETEFHGLKLKVKPGVLIPRPETEELVDLIIKENKEPGLKVLDIGTGSGCIAIALKANLNNCDTFALDVSNKALKIARDNAKINNVKIQFYEADILNEFPSFPPLDIIISNPPYVLEEEKPQMNKNVLDFEPHEALFVSGKNPLLHYEAITKQSAVFLKKKGKVYFEINEKFGKEIAEMLRRNGFGQVIVIKDMQQKDRFVKGIKM